jgi:signal peptidase
MMAWLYLTVHVCLLLWVVATMLVFGWTANVTSSGSMAPAVRAGDVILTSPPGDEPLGVGSVIAYRAEGSTITHRITAIEDDGSYRTRGDANADEDPVAVRPDQIVGAGRLLVPIIGLPAHWFRSGDVWSLGGWLAITITALALAPTPATGRRPRADR